MKRVLLFLATNIAVMIVLSISATLLEGFLAARGVHIPQQQLLVYAFVFGMGGSFISLLLRPRSCTRPKSSSLTTS